MWQKYFKLKKIVPGRVVTRHGTIDFSKNNLSLELLKTLYESDFPYLEITDEGMKTLYGIKPKKTVVKKPPVYVTPAENLPEGIAGKPKPIRKRKTK